MQTPAPGTLRWSFTDPNSAFVISKESLTQNRCLISHTPHSPRRINWDKQVLESGASLKLTGKPTSFALSKVFSDSSLHSPQTGKICLAYDDGTVSLINSSLSPLVTIGAKGQPPVLQSDFNPIIERLATANTSIAIWDLEKKQVQNLRDQKFPALSVSSLNWNPLRQSAIAVSDHNALSIWDVRSTDKAVIRLNLKGAECVSWDCSRETILAVAINDPSNSVVQCMDLRFINKGPIYQIRGHSGGVSSVSFCPEWGQHILLSGGKDNSIRASSSINGEELLNLPSMLSVVEDIQCSPLAPSVFSASIPDHHVSIMSLNNPDSSDTGNAEVFALFGASPDQPAQRTHRDQLKIAPQYLKRPSSVAWAPNGTLITVGKTVSLHPISGLAPDVLIEAQQFRQALESDSILPFVQSKIQSLSSASQSERDIWQLIHALYRDDSRRCILDFLGFKAPAVKAAVEQPPPPQAAQEPTQEPLEEDSFFGSIRQPEEHTEEPTAVPTKVSTMSLTNSDDVDGKIAQAVAQGDFSAAVDLCLDAKRYAEALVLSSCGSDGLWEKTQAAYIERQDKPYLKVVRAVMGDRLSDVVAEMPLNQWKQTLAVLTTYSKGEEWPGLCGQLAKRLATEQGGSKEAAMMCFMCAGEVESAASAWINHPMGQNTRSSALLILVEKAVLLRRATTTQSAGAPPPLLGHLLASYASLLASIGDPIEAVGFMRQVMDPRQTQQPEENDPLAAVLNRLDGGAPLPYARVDVQPQSIPEPEPVYQEDYSQGGYGWQAPPGQQPFAHRQQSAAPHAPGQYGSPMPGPPMGSSPAVRPPPARAAAPYGSPLPPTGPAYGTAPPPSRPPAQQQPPSRGPPPMGGGSPAVHPGQYGSPMPGPPMGSSPAVRPPPARAAAPYGSPLPPTGPAYGTAPPPSRPPAQQQPPSRGPPPMGGGSPAVHPGQYGSPMPGPPKGSSPAVRPPASGPSRPPAPMSPGGGRAGDQPVRPSQPIRSTSASSPMPTAASPSPNIRPTVSSDVQPIINTLWALLDQCKGQLDRRHKAKVDEAGRKLVSLGKLLAEGKVSPRVLTGLHGLAQALSMRDYDGASRQASALAKSDFAETVSWMAGVKKLIEAARSL